ncbi:ATP-dependent nuclease [Rhizobium laguerreae]|uniref:ATP-dependent nuclease n=1 Tax=Rhizobium laguerreae TaxID=1076926 RepID=UPI001C908B32|nr:AAA family ATPase [Rhizobium laguerreae]MBY3442400.1 AAA family ATPase [Rhizobium laguerreae]
MLSSMAFKFGAADGQPPLVLQTPPSVTIFVGPNNSGKSQALREIGTFFSSGRSEGKILTSIAFNSFSEEEARAELGAMIDELRQGEMLSPDNVMIKWSRGRTQTHVPSFMQLLMNPASNLGAFASYYAEKHILTLDGPSRILLLNPQARGDLKYPDSIFARLLTDDQRRTDLRKLIKEATGLTLVLDASVGDQLNVRFGKGEPPNERSYEDATLEYMRKAQGVEGVSDGVKAFAGILLQLHVGSPKVITVDEPEAFLHPSLAFKLGKELARGAVEERKHIFAATHSAQFLMGAITSGASVNIVRLTYSGGRPTARLLQSNDLRVLMQDPLLRSVGVLEGLFYDCVVVGEANADRAFYQEINERMLAGGDPRGIPHALFLNADNKQTIPRIIAPLRKLGIPAAGVTDIDILKDGGVEWTRHLQAAGIPQGEFDAYAARRKTVLKALQDMGKDFKREGGIALLTGQDLEVARNLFADLRRYGLFVVTRGEVENWLEDLNVDRGKNTWLRSIFDKMGADPREAEYIRPTRGDVWDYVGEIGLWLKDNMRSGIPL